MKRNLMRSLSLLPAVLMVLLAACQNKSMPVSPSGSLQVSPKLGAGIQPVDCAAKTAEYLDDFSSDTLGNYSIFGDHWSVESPSSQGYAVMGGELLVAPVAGSAYSFALVSNERFRRDLGNYTVEADFQQENANDAVFGVIFRANPEAREAYIFQWNGQNGQWEIEKKTPGGFEYPGVNGGFPRYVGGTTVHLRVVAGPGNAFCATVNGQVVFEGETDEYGTPYSTGAVGIRAYEVDSSRPLRVDNFAAYDCTDCEGDSGGTPEPTPTNTPFVDVDLTPIGSPMPTLTMTPEPTVTGCGTPIFIEGFEDDFIANRPMPDHIYPSMSSPFSPINECRPAATGFNTLRDRDILDCSPVGGFQPIANVALDLTDGNSGFATFFYELPAMMGAFEEGDTVSIEVVNFGSDGGHLHKFLSVDGLVFTPAGDDSDHMGIHQFAIPGGARSVFLKVQTGTSAGIFEGVWVDNFAVTKGGASCATPTPYSTPPVLETPSETPSVSEVPSRTPTEGPTLTPTPTDTPVPTATPTPPPEPTPTPTPDYSCFENCKEVLRVTMEFIHVQTATARVVAAVGCGVVCAGTTVGFPACVAGCILETYVYIDVAEAIETAGALTAFAICGSGCPAIPPGFGG